MDLGPHPLQWRAVRVAAAAASGAGPVIDYVPDMRMVVAHRTGSAWTWPQAAASTKSMTSARPSRLQIANFGRTVYISMRSEKSTSAPDEIVLQRYFKFEIPSDEI